MLALLFAFTAVTVHLSGLHYGHESGTATLTQQAGGVRIVMNLTGAPNNVPQPTHIHTGTCSKNTATDFALHNLINGKSDTVLKGITLAELTSGKYLINVHESTENLQNYVSCGAIGGRQGRGRLP